MSYIFTVAPKTFKVVNGRTDHFRIPQRPEDFGTSLELSSARNTRAAWNVLLGAVCEDYLLNVGKTDCFCNEPDILRLRVAADFPLPVKLNIVGTVTDDDYFRKGEILLEKDYVTINRKDCAQIYCEAEIPKDTAPDTYEGVLRLYSHRGFEAEQLCGEVSVKLTVYPYALPDKRDSKFYLDLWQHSSIAASRCETKIWSDDHFRVLEGIVKSLSELGQRAVTIIATEVPWFGQSCDKNTLFPSSLFEYSIVAITKEKDGSFTYDYSAMQRYIDLCARYGIDREISIYGLANIWGDAKPCEDCFDKLRVRYLDKADGAYKYMTSLSDIDLYISDLEQYFVKTGQIDKVRVAADEPGDIEAFRRTLSHLKSIAPAFKYKAAVNHVEFIEEFADDIYDVAPALPWACSQHEVLMRFKDTQPDKRFLHYICCWPPYPNTYIRSSLCESLFLGVITSYLRMDGLLRWAYTCWPDNPREEIRYHPGDWAAGDTCFIYPSYNGAPLLSIRYKALQFGIELFEMLEALREKKGDEAVGKAYDYVLREKDYTKMYKPRFEITGSNRDELLSTEYKDYAALEEYLLKELS